MAATVNIREKNGAGETPTNKDGSTVRFKNADDATVDTNDPLIIPTSGQEYSYEKWLRYYIGATGPSQYITNLNVYCDGTLFGATEIVWYATDTAYSTPVVPNEGDDPPHHDAVDMTDFSTKTSGSKLSLGTGQYSTTSADCGDYLVLVMEVNNGATPGILTGETTTFEYDEI